MFYWTTPEEEFAGRLKLPDLMGSEMKFASGWEKILEGTALIFV